MTRTALVTGGNRGIGFEVCRQFAQQRLRVILTSRNAKQREATTRVLRDQENLDVHYAEMDVSSERSVRRCAERLLDEGVHVDVLVNNVAVFPSSSVLKVEPATMEGALHTNVLGPLWTYQAWEPAMLRQGYGRVVNVSSGWGTFGEGMGGPVAYSVPKATLNALTVKLATEVRGDINVNAVCPGWVRTRMGGPGATRSVEKGADTSVWLATLASGGPNGGFFRDRSRIEW